jgi:hypothetical protein
MKLVSRTKTAMRRCYWLQNMKGGGAMLNWSGVRLGAPSKPERAISVSLADKTQFGNGSPAHIQPRM